MGTSAGQYQTHQCEYGFTKRMCSGAGVWEDPGAFSRNIYVLRRSCADSSQCYAHIGSYCSVEKTCLGGATCEDDGSGAKVCTCAPGHEGVYSEVQEYDVC